MIASFIRSFTLLRQYLWMFLFFYAGMFWISLRITYLWTRCLGKTFVHEICCCILAIRLLQVLVRVWMGDLLCLWDELYFVRTRFIDRVTEHMSGISCPFQDQVLTICRFWIQKLRAFKVSKPILIIVILFNQLVIRKDKLLLKRGSWAGNGQLIEWCRLQLELMGQTGCTLSS